MFLKDDVERGSGIYRADAKLFEHINLKEGTYFQQFCCCNVSLYLITIKFLLKGALNCQSLVVTG